MTTQSPITFGVELEFLVPFLLDHEDDPLDAAGTDDKRPVTRVSETHLAFSAVQVAIYDLLKKHNFPVQISPEASSTLDKGKSGVHLPRYWSVDSDVSVVERRKAFGYEWVAVELRSPVLTTTSEDHKHVAQVVKLLRKHFRVRVNQTTGFHVHIGMGAEPLPPRVVYRMAQILWCADGMLSGLHPPERVLGTHAASIRHTSHLAIDASESWKEAARHFDASTAKHRKPPRRNTKRGSFDESSTVRDLLWNVEKLSYLRDYAARGAEIIKRERDGKTKVEIYQKDMQERYDKSIADYHQVARYHKTLFGDWEFSFPAAQENGSGTGPAQKEVAWIMDTETMVPSIWAELMHQNSPELQNVSLHAVSEYCPIQRVEQQPEKQPEQLPTEETEQKPVKDKGKSPAVPASAYDNTKEDTIKGDTDSFVNTRQNPFQDPGARSRYLEIHGTEMPKLTDQEWLALDDAGTRLPIPLAQGLLFMTNPDLHDDTRRIAYMVSSAAGYRCNYNFNSYGFPHMQLKKPIMTIEFREATGSMNADWITAWASICAGIAEFCLGADEGQFLGVLMRLVEAEINESLVKQGRGDADLLGYDVLCFLSDLALKTEATYIKEHLGYGDKNAFWFPCRLIPTNQMAFGSPKAVGEGPGVLSP